MTNKMQNIQFHTRETSANELWLDISVDGKKVGYIYKRRGGNFYNVSLKVETLAGEYTTLERAKVEAGRKLRAEWPDQIV